MTPNYFKSIRRSYAINILFSAVLSNLTAFGQPLQQILYDKQHLNTAIHNYHGSYNNHNVPNPDTADTNNTIANLHEHSLPVTQQSYVRGNAGSRVFFASEDTGVIGNLYGAGDENPDDNYFTVILPDNIDLERHTAVLAYDVYGLQDAGHATKSINHNLSYGGRAVATGNNWKSVSEIIPASQLVKGANEIFFNKRTDTTYEYQIKNLRIELQPKTDKAFTLSGQYLINYNGTVYISGIASDANITSVNVAGKQLTLTNGFLEDVITNVSRDINSLDISYTGANGEIVKTKYNILYTTENIAHNFTESGLNRTLSVYNSNDINKGFVNFENSLTISNLCADNNKSLVIAEGLAFKDIRTLNSDLTNVTGGNYRAYNIKKAYVSDANPVQLHLKYNPEAIPDGYTAKDVRTYYFDKNLRAWKELATDSLDYTNNEIITSIYDNDTDYINGVIKVPDSPESGSFAPTTITDMKVADPAAGVISIPPPTPNSTGNATTSFPIKLPQGRNGMQPSLEVTYNSEAGNSWMGIGWNISTPAITVNTKWGVPLFDTNTETELYSLNGADLVFKIGTGYTDAQKQANIARAGEREFYMRKEGAYNKIIRHGAGTDNYWWEVIDKQGNRSFYGSSDGSTVNQGHIIRNDNAKIVHWALSKITDPYGNTVDYTYTAPTSVVATTESGTQIVGKAFYPLTIEYTKGNNTANYYKVLFELTDRLDITTDYRNRYVRCDNKLLTRVRIVFAQSGQTDQLVRRYDFKYLTKAFQKQQLTEIAEYDSSNNLFYNNKLEYYEHSQPDALFASQSSWTSGSDNINSDLASLGASTGIIPSGSILGTSTSSGFSVGGRIGGGIGLKFWNIAGTVGGSGNYSKNTQDTKISFIDVNGDGLPDKVFANANNEIWYRPNMLTATISPSNSFGTPIQLKNISSIGSTKSNTFGGGVDGNLGGFGIGKSKSETRSETDNYFTDFNGDGLPDIVKGTRVLFNTTDTDNNNQDTALRKFNNSSAFTENPVVAGTINGDAGVVDDLQLPSMNQLRQQHPQFDHVKVWEAPYDGKINIEGNAYLIQKNGSNVNEFKVSIERRLANGAMISMLPINISSPIVLNNIYTTPSGSLPGSNVSMAMADVQVTKGTMLFFRIHNMDNGSGGVVHWNPAITYTELLNTDIALNSTDDNGKYLKSFNSDQDFILQNGGYTNVATGSVGLNFNLTSTGFPQLTDDVTFTIKRTRIKLDDGEAQTATSTWTKKYLHATNSFDGNPNTVTYTGIPPTGYKDIYTFYAESTSNINWSAIKWSPTITSNGQTTYANVNYKVYDENVNSRKYWLLKSELPSVGSITNSTDGNTVIMTISHNFLEQDLSGMISGLEDNTSVRVTWAIKSEEKNTSGATVFKTLLSKVFYVLKTTGGNYTVSSSAINSVPLTTAYTTYSLRKQQIKNIIDCPTGKLFSAFYVDNRMVAVNNAADVTLTLLQNQLSNYAGYVSPKTITRPFFSLNGNIIGNTHRGWNEFLYNGGLSLSLQDYGDNVIDLSIFEPTAQQSNPEGLPGDFDPDSASEGDIGDVETTPRYMMYSHNTLDNKFINKNIINSAYGPITPVSGLVRATIGRFGEADLYNLYINPDTFFNGQSVPNNQMYAIKQRSKSKGKAVSANAGYEAFGFNFGANGTLSEASSEVLNQYIDLNGDRYPDFISKSKIQFTNMQGGLSNLPVMSIGNGFITSDNSKDFTKGVTIAGIQPNSTKTANNSSRNKTVTNADSGINQSSGTSFDSKQWADINGDGLTDKIQINEHSIDVWLNKGYGFTDKIIWFSNNDIDLTTSWRSSNNGGANFSFGASFGAGFGAAASTANMGTFLADITGDGLPELIFTNGNNTNYRYYLNTGRGFASNSNSLPSGDLDSDKSFSGNLFGTASYGFPVSIVPPIKIVPSLSGGVNGGVNEKKATLQDLNGDGLPDIISGATNASITVKYNNIGNTYLLKKVNTPLGGSWEVEYARTGNTYTMPNSKWVMTKITTNDGFNKDNTLLGSPDITRTSIEYKKPNYSRKERDFLGFGEVRINQLNTDNSVYRYTVKEYHNENYYLSGAEKRSALYSPQNTQQPLTEQTTMYNLLNPETPSVSFNVSAATSYMQENMAGNWQAYIEKSRLFLAPVRIISSSYEGTNGLNATKEFLEYDEFGNIEQFLDRGDSTTDAYRTEITYTTPTGILYGKSYPTRIKVLQHSNNQLMRQRDAVYYEKGKLKQIITKLNSTENRTVDFTYDNFGNMTKFTDTDNKNSQNLPYWVEISYDNIVNTYPVKVKNAFDEETATVYNYLFGVPVLTTDPNGKKMRTRIDNRSRVVEITGPNEMATDTQANNGWTIRTEYKGEGALQANLATDSYVIPASGQFLAGNGTTTDNEHFAVTKHFDPEIHAGSSTPTNQMVTISIVDGFGQPVQVKKSHIATAAGSGSAPTSLWIISGLDRKDAFGRVIRSYDTTIQPYNTGPTTLDATVDKKYFSTQSLPTAFTETNYDQRDRVLNIKQPGESTAAQVQYSIEESKFKQKQINERGKFTETYTDIRGRQRTVKQEGSIVTNFKYNAINELMMVIDNDSKETRYTYDLAGRKLKVGHPDRGMSSFTYNKVGQVTKQSTANLSTPPNNNLTIDYTYDWTHLLKVTYPLTPQNNVKYIYGRKADTQLSAGHNAIGRVLYQEDASGVQVFAYGNMGEVVKSLRSVAVPGSSPYWFLTQWQYDSWNRVQQIIYPDFEVVNYNYNKAGALFSITSNNLPGTTTPLPAIVSEIRYNNLGQRSMIQYGNGSVTTYGYDARQRLEFLQTSFNANYSVNKQYKYDGVSNIIDIITNNTTSAIAAPGSLGGQVTHLYKYDDYNRLYYATGSYTGRNDSGDPYLRHSYVLDMEYNTNHTIKKKTQNHTIGTSAGPATTVNSPVPATATSYNLDYSGYGAGAFSTQGNTSTESYGWQQPHAVTTVKETPVMPQQSTMAVPPLPRERSYSYDASGNQVSIKQKESNGAFITTRRNLWDEENRLMGVDLKPDDPTAHPIAAYTYDATGERIVRHNFDRSDVYSSGAEIGNGYKDNIMLYPSGLVMAKVIHIKDRKGDRYDQLLYTKHYYIGAERIAARTGSLEQMGYYPGTQISTAMPKLGAGHSFPIVQGGTLNTTVISNYMAQGAMTKATAYIYQKVFDKFVPQTQRPALVNRATPALSSSPAHIIIPPVLSYYFHPDHLGSSSYMSGNGGSILQHMEYLPFGEAMMDEHINSRNNPFKYNGKHLDGETGNYYYGARYYDPKLSNFISVDPLAEQTFSPYGYCYNNPINLTDPTGMSPEGGEDWVRKDGKWEYRADIRSAQEAKDAGYDGYAANGSVIHAKGNGSTGYYKLLDDGYGRAATKEEIANADNSGNFNTEPTKSSVRSSIVEPSASKLAEVTGNTIAATEIIRDSKVGDLMRGGQERVKSITKGLKIAGNVMGAISALSTITDYANGNISSTEAGWDLGMAAFGMLPIPGAAAVSLLYSIGKATYEYSTGESLFEKPAPEVPVSRNSLKL